MRQIRHHYSTYPVDTSELVLKGLGVRERMGPGTVNRPHGIETHLFVFFHTDVTDQAPQRPRGFSSGTLIVWEPGFPHDFGDLGKCWSHSWLLASGEFISDELERQSIPVNKPLAIPAAELMDNALTEIDREVSTAVPPSFEIIRNILQNFLIQVGRLASCPSRSGSVIPNEYLEIKAFMDENHAQRLTLAELARRVGRSRLCFANRFRRLFGVSPVEYMIRRRMAEASYLLHNHNMSVKEVAEAVGCGNPQYFSRLFRARFGMGPQSARKAFAIGACSIK